MNPTRKFEIVELFLENGNKTATAKVFDVSPRTVGRIVKEYEGLEPPYSIIFDIANQLILPKTTISEYDGSEVELGTLLYAHVNTDVDVSVLPDNVTFEQIFNDEPIEFDSNNHGLDEETPVSISVDTYQYDLVATTNSVTITRTDGATIESIDAARGTTEFRDAWGLIREIDITNQSHVNEVGQNLWERLDKTYALETFSQGKITVDPNGESVIYDGNPISNKLSRRIIDLVKERGQEGVQLLVNFLEKLMENPSYRAVNSLYDFLLHNDIEIIDNGNFYAWKFVTSDFKDCYTKTMDNSVGQVVEMPRNMVNEDPEQTCSAGLHVCAKHYLTGHWGDNIVKCEVDPRDVVAIPIDYNNAKMRTCRYKVVEDVTEKFRD
ncbi:MAG: helix-turn-helix domain-containing protein [Nitrosopumilaceae archaeon]|nr:helix-turn-helix domain-containing protein [Nitrosopumilaceae archaeon]